MSIKIEIVFPVDVHLSMELVQGLDQLITKHVCEPYNKAHPDRTMWVSGFGEKVIFSQVDAALLGRQEYDKTIPNGDGPRYDEDTYEISITERERY